MRPLLPDNAKIDAEWVIGLRAWVKRTFATRSYRSYADALAHVKRLRDVELEQLWEHLSYTKGLLPYPIIEGGARDRTETDHLRDKVSEEIIKAREVLDEGYSYNAWIMRALTPGQFEYTERPDIRASIKSDAQLTAIFAEKNAETIEKTESILSGKLLRAVTAWLKKSNRGLAYRTEPLHLERSIGRVNVVFAGDYVPSAKSTTRSVREFNQYTRYFVDAKRMLEAKGFGALWYGPIFISCQTCGGENQHGAHFGVSGHYVPTEDYVRVFTFPSPFIVQLLVHELGHRYYYKFMSAADRARFDAYFGHVAAIDEYGAEATEEDFAMAFEHFVMERDMTRDQIDRFKAFLARKERRRFLPNNGKKQRR